MNYILDNDGYIFDVSFGALIECDLGTCTEYSGDVPTGYDDLNDWAENACINAYKIVSGNLVLDATKQAELETSWEKEIKDNSPVIHSELYGLQEQLEDIQDVNDSQYKKDTASGKIINISNVKKVFPKVKLTNIQPYVSNTIKLITTGKNILPNEATTQTIGGVEFTQNVDRSITISGTSTEAIEYNLAGTSTNTSAFLVFKKDKTYYLSSNSKTITMYSYDGTDRTQIYSGTGGTITFNDSDKEVTQIVLSIANGTTINETIYPQLEYGSSASSYEMYKSRILNIDLTDYIETGLFPSETLYPSETLFPSGSTIDYVLIESGNITALINNEETYINTGNVGLFDGVDVIYTIQDLDIEIDYCINNLALEGTTTKDDNFKILEDGSIVAKNGTFTGGEISITDDGTNDIDTAHLVIGSDNQNSYLKSNALYFDNATENSKASEYRDDGFTAQFLNWVDGNTYIVSSKSTDLTASIEAQVYDRSTEEILSLSRLSNEGLYVTAGEDYSTVCPTYMESAEFIQTSLESKKKNFKKFNKSAIDIINSTDIYNYNLKTEEDTDKKHIGLVIGDKYKYSKEILNNKNSGVDLYSMISVCFKAIQEQQILIEDLKQKIKESESDK